MEALIAADNPDRKCRRLLKHSPCCRNRVQEVKGNTWRCANILEIGNANLSIDNCVYVYSERAPARSLLYFSFVFPVLGL